MAHGVGAIHKRRFFGWPNNTDKNISLKVLISDFPYKVLMIPFIHFTNFFRGFSYENEKVVGEFFACLSKKWSINFSKLVGQRGGSKNILYSPPFDNVCCQDPTIVSQLEFSRVL